MSTGTVGTIQELAVSIDLLRRGMAVFRALSHSCPFDLAVLVGAKLVRVEVTTGYYTKAGKLSSPKESKDRSKFDVLATVTTSGIVYQPDIDSVIRSYSSRLLG